jgi:cytochrome P450
MTVTSQFDHNSPEFIANPYPVYSELRERDPVHFSEAYGGYYVLTRYEDVRNALLDWELFSSARPGVTSIPASVKRDFQEIPLEFDPPDHTPYRKLISQFFTRNAIKELEPGFHDIAAGLLGPMVEAGGGDFVQDFALPYVSRVLAYFLQVPGADSERWIQWAKAIFHGRLTDRAMADRASDEMIAYVDSLAEERRQAPGHDLFSVLVTAQFHGRALTAEELHGYGVLMLNAGQETSVNGIGNSLWYLAEHPDDRERLMREPELLDDAIEEFLRLMSPIQLLGRTTTAQTVLHGRDVPAESTVAMCYAAANRDPERFTDADQCVIDRRPNPHLAFGSGPHTCLGAHLARAEIRVALQEVFRMMPGYRLDPDGSIEFTPHGDLRGFWKLPMRVS